MTARVQANIDTRALLHNVAVIKRHLSSQKIMAMVKANAYGHGDVAVAKALASEVSALAVATIEEAIALREQDIKTPTIVSMGAQTPEDIALAQQYDLGLVVYEPSQVMLLQSLVEDSPALTVWLKVDTGMHRLGFTGEAVKANFDRLSLCSAVQQPPHVMAHFSMADDTDSDKTQNQIDRFLDWTRDIEAPKSMANSAAIITRSDSLADWVRPGILLYGISPFTKKSAASLGLKPVMTLTAPLVAINYVKAGETVGYGGRFTCPEDMPVGVVAIGYGDGYPRHATHKTPVLLNGKQTTLVGTVSMDFTTIDLRPCPDAQVGQRVTMWGEGLPVEQVAETATTIPYELVTTLTQRVEHVYD